MANFSGSFKCVSRDNLDAFLTAAGATPEQMTLMKNMEVVQTITQNGDSFTIERKLPKKTISNTFTIGQEANITNIQGKEMKTTVTRDGNKLVATAEGFKQVTEIDGDTLTDTITAHGVTMVRRSKRQ